MDLKWHEDWMQLTKEQEEVVLRELQLEIKHNPRHPLYAKKLELLRGVLGQDDFLFYLPEDRIFAYVHLSWHSESDPMFPFCLIFQDTSSLDEFVLKPDWVE